MNGLFRAEPDYPERVSASVRNHLLGLDARRVIDARFERIWEAHLMSAARQLTDASSAFGAIDAEKHFSSIHECASNVISDQHPDLRAVPVAHFAYLTAIALICCSVALLILVFESFARRFRRNLRLGRPRWPTVDAAGASACLSGLSCCRGSVSASVSL